MSICIDKLNENISSPCTNPLFAGKRRKGWLFNRADISSYTTDPLNDHIVNNITLASGAKGYFIQADVKLPFNASVSAMNEGDYTNDFTHNVVCYIPNDGADWRENIVNKIANGEFVVVLENKWTGNNGDNQFQIFGLQQGLLAVSDVNEDAENGGWNFTLQENGTPMSGMYYWHTDEETSRNDLDALAGGGGGEDWTPKWFYVEDASGAANTLTIKKSNNALPDKVFEWSLDKQNWTEITVTDTTGVSLAVPANGRVYLRGDNGALATWSYYTNIKCAAAFNVGGDATCLLVKSGSQMMMSAYAFVSLFNQSRIVDAGDMTLPATILASSCYQDMFNGCTNLTSAPALPATTLASYCYQDMFNGCTNLTSAPALPATTLASYCYQDMFNGCTNLTSAPALPATTLALYCYQNMFNGCTNLTSAPALPATTLASFCYQDMFNGCTNLTSAPALPATTLASYCYQNMFNGCTALTESADMAATTTAEFSLGSMYWGCNNLAKVVVRVTTWNTSDASNWLKGVAATGDFYNLGGATIPTSTNGIPRGWTEHTQLP